jgi:hypothetical protein
MKKKIVDLAIGQMKAGGYENLSFAQIASELSTNRANVHHHYPPDARSQKVNTAHGQHCEWCHS